MVHTSKHVNKLQVKEEHVPFVQTALAQQQAINITDSSSKP